MIKKKKRKKKCVSIYIFFYFYFLFFTFDKKIKGEIKREIKKNMGNNQGLEKCKKVLINGEKGICETKYLSHDLWGYKIVECPVVDCLENQNKWKEFIAEVKITPSDDGVIIRGPDGYGWRTNKYSIGSIQKQNGDHHVRNFRLPCRSVHMNSHSYQENQIYEEPYINRETNKIGKGYYFQPLGKNE